VPLMTIPGEQAGLASLDWKNWKKMVWKRRGSLSVAYRKGRIRLWNDVVQLSH